MALPDQACAVCGGPISEPLSTLCDRCLARMALEDVPATELQRLTEPDAPATIRGRDGGWYSEEDWRAYVPAPPAVPASPAPRYPLARIVERGRLRRAAAWVAAKYRGRFIRTYYR